MTAAVKLVLAPPLGAGSPPLVCPWMGDGMLHRRALPPRGPSAFGLDLGAELLLQLLILTDAQTSSVPELGFGAPGSHGTRITCRGRTLDVPARDHRHGLPMRTGDTHGRKVQGEGIRGEERAHLWPGARHAVHA